MDKILKLIDKIKDFKDGEKLVDAKLIKVSSIKTAFWVRFKCRLCVNYNTNLNCPPYSPSPDEMNELLKCYQDAILIICQIQTKKDLDLVNPSKIAVNLEKIAINMGFYKAIGFGAGSCKHCEICNLKSCINRDIARPSMESTGIDVTKTAKNNGYEMLEYNEDGEKILYFFSLILLK
ncbi:MAG: DUF2284 domain-containing protein [Methanobrevibacter sp.]|nr:DUF2284 domain-containing protein [Candidatus Methanovirga basalitermitum]